MMMKDYNQELAEKIAELIGEHGKSGVSTDLDERLAGIYQRLEQIEKRLETRDPRHPIHDFDLSHPSLQKFDVIEAIADQIMENHAEEKACTFEPNGKPCDHCSMCSSRGF
ncbi:MAG: hypothetical protein R2681_06040 [Pyrinomonadaceae bacterium]